MKRICFSPFDGGGNNYVERTKSLATESVEGCSLVSLPRKNELLKKPFLILHIFFKNKYDFFVLSWHENRLRSKSGRLSFTGVIKFFVYFLLYKMLSKKIIYVRHNLYPHGMKGSYAKVAYYLTNFIERFCDAKVTHSSHLSASGYFYIPHPLYSFDTSLDFQVNDVSDYKILNYYIIFGRLTRYKKIETVIERWDSETSLLIAGSGSDDAYLNDLKKLAEGKSVIFDVRFIEESEAQELVAKSKGMILAHADLDMIVSGSFFYAVTLGTPVYAVEKPFFRWLKKEKSFDGLYLYENPKELVNDLTSFKEGSSFRNEPSRDDVRRQAELLFGDAAVRNAWHDLLTRMAS